MNARLIILTAFAIGVGAGFVVGCQTYDFVPVQPIALAQVTETHDVFTRRLKPNVMLLVDKSQSMDLPADPSNAKCYNDAGMCGAGKGFLCDTNPSSSKYCPTRWSELQGAMSDFLGDAGTVARFGMAVFPNVSPASGACALRTALPDGGTTTPADIRADIVQSDDVASDLQAQATTIRDDLLAIQSSNTNASFTTVGGTPTQDSLRYIGSASALNDTKRQNFVLLLTDGIPNCNPNNPNTWNSPNCRCTLQGCNSGTGALGCLDMDGTVAEVSALRGLTPEIRTIVVGFGAETASGDGPMVLNAMAQAGGMARACPDGTDAACGPGDTCNPVNKICNRAFYQASSRDQLVSALAKISELIGQGDPCVFVLTAAPTDPKLLSVLIDGQVTQAGPDTWQYDSNSNTVTLQGTTCQRVKTATDQNQVKVEIRILQGL